MNESCDGLTCTQCPSSITFTATKPLDPEKYSALKISQVREAAPLQPSMPGILQVEGSQITEYGVHGHIMLPNKFLAVTVENKGIVWRRTAPCGYQGNRKRYTPEEVAQAERSVPRRLRRMQTMPEIPETRSVSPEPETDYSMSSETVEASEPRSMRRLKTEPALNQKRVLSPGFRQFLKDCKKEGTIGVSLETPRRSLDTDAIVQPQQPSRLTRRITSVPAGLA